MLYPLSYEGAPCKYTLGCLGRLGNCQVWIPFRLETLGSPDHPYCSGGHSWSKRQRPANLVKSFVTFFVVALQTAGHQVFPGIFTAARLWLNMVNRVGCTGNRRIDVRLDEELPVLRQGSCDCREFSRSVKAKSQMAVGTRHWRCAP
jgi:hypothetical protein